MTVLIVFYRFIHKLSLMVFFVLLYFYYYFLLHRTCPMFAPFFCNSYKYLGFLLLTPYYSYIII